MGGSEEGEVVRQNWLAEGSKFEASIHEGGRLGQFGR